MRRSIPESHWHSVPLEQPIWCAESSDRNGIWVYWHLPEPRFQVQLPENCMLTHYTQDVFCVWKGCAVSNGLGISALVVDNKPQLGGMRLGDGESWGSPRPATNTDQTPLHDFTYLLTYKVQMWLT